MGMMDKEAVGSYQSSVIGGVRKLGGVHFQSGGVAGGAGANERIRSRWSCLGLLLSTLAGKETGKL